MVEGTRRGTGVLRGEPPWDEGQISCPHVPPCTPPPASSGAMCRVQVPFSPHVSEGTLSLSLMSR